jgi:hypothetical protein
MVGDGDGMAAYPELADEVSLFMADDESDFLLKS